MLLLLAHLWLSQLIFLSTEKRVFEPDGDWLFCHRWLLLDFKREFENEQVMLLWEVRFFKVVIVVSVKFVAEYLFERDFKGECDREKSERLRIMKEKERQNENEKK